jgi:hypothetical protein
MIKKEKDVIKIAFSLVNVIILNILQNFAVS